MATPSEEKNTKPKIPWYQDVDGFRIPGMFSIAAYKSAVAYKPRSDDLFIITYPKCGTTWVQNIVACIFRDGKPFGSALEFFSETPFLEMAGADAAEKMKRPGAIKLHLPFHLTPWSPEAKYIFVARNPKDCCVSFFHHTESMPGYVFEDGEFDDYFELFINGEVDFGDYFETTLSWWEHRNDPNVLFITYEQLKKDTVNNVLKIAQFIGPEYKENLEKNEKMLKDVIHHSSFNFMKEHLNRHLEEMFKIPKEMIRNNPDIPSGMREMLLGEKFEMKKKDAPGMTFVRKEFLRLLLNMSSLSEEKKPQKTPWYQDIDGFRLPGMFSAEAYRSALAYKPRPGDLFIVTYPKCGTTWVQNIVACIFREGKAFTSALQFFTETPFLEMTGAKAAEVLKRPGALKLHHLPFRLTPWSPEAKYIFVARNPKDCFVSFYYHTEGMPGYRFEDGSLDVFFELFMKGEVEFGDYFETTLSWWEHRNDPNVLFITYEQLKKDTKGYVLKIAEFIDPKYREKLEKDDKMLQDVIHHSSFAFMKEHLNRNLEELMAMPKDMVEKNPDIPQGLRKMLLSGNFQMKKKDAESVTFVRKGIIGDWKNHLSPEQNARLEKRFKEKFAGTGLLELWKDEM